MNRIPPGVLLRAVLRVVLLVAAWVTLYAAGEMRYARGQNLSAPEQLGGSPSPPPARLGDCVHFVLYYSEPVPDDPDIIGHCRAGHVVWVFPDGRITLHYSTAGRPNEPDNPPAFTERKIWREHAWPPKPSTWHYCKEHEEARP